MTKTDDKPDVGELTATAVLELARLGRVTDDTYDALKAAIAPQPQDGDEDDQGDDKSEPTDASKASGARKATTR